MSRRTVTETIAETGGSGPDYDLGEQVGYLLRRAHQRATAMFQAEMAGEPVTPTQWAALVRLAEHGALSQNHLGRLTAMDPATIQGVVQRLARRGLVEQRRDPDDRRRAQLVPTAEGRALVERLTATAKRVSEATLEPLNARERVQLLDLLRRIGRHG